MHAKHEEAEGQEQLRRTVAQQNLQGGKGIRGDKITIQALIQNHPNLKMTTILHRNNFQVQLLKSPHPVTANPTSQENPATLLTTPAQN